MGIIALGLIIIIPIGIVIGFFVFNKTKDKN